MPGPRLTHTDRRQIAAWLGDGLGYAEIARRLGRPTSTISREVARNGEPGIYRADHAQHAATRRAPRRAPGDRPSAEVEPAFADQFAGLLAATGFPRMSARVFVCLLISDAGLTAAELVRRLRVSPATISKAIAYLCTMDLAARRPEPGSRRERYLVADDVWQRAWQTDTGAHAEVAAAARRGADLLGPGTPGGARLHEMSRFFTWLSEQMRGSQDALTVLAALLHAQRPLTTPELAAALGWPAVRVAGALAAATRPGRLTAGQLHRLGCG